MKKILVCASLMLATVAYAQPTIDGWDIPNSFSEGVELAAQSNATHFGNQLVEVTTSGFTPGSELNAVYVAQDANFLYIGLTGNLEERGHAFGIFIDAGELDGWVGQTEMWAEIGDGYNRPPQIASYQWEIDTNGNDDPTDDTWSYGTDTTSLPFAADYLCFVNHHRGNIYGNEFILYGDTHPDLPLAETHDPTPDNPNDPEAELFCTKTYFGNTVVNDGNEVIEGDPGNNWSSMGMDNTNVLGVTDLDATAPESAITGLEVAIPLSNIGYGLFGDEELKIFIVMWDGAEGDMEGAIVQTLPTDTPCPDPIGAIGLYPDMSAYAYLTVDLNTLPTFSGTSEGAIDSTEYGLPTMADAQALQACPTPYGDQVIEGVEQTIRVQNGSELDVLYAHNDNNFLYIGATGNLEPNWNRFYLFIDSDPATGINLLENINELPNPATLPVDTNGVAVNFDHAYKFGYDAGSYPTGYLDYFDLNTGIKTWMGGLQADSGSGAVTGGSNPNGLEMALGSFNGDGVMDGYPGDGGLFDNGTWTELTTQAYTAVEGFEMAIPLADLGLTAADLPRDIHIWAIVWNNNSDWASNQSLPPMRNRSTGGNQTENPGGSPNFNDPAAVAPRNYEAWAAKYTMVGGAVPVDVVDAFSMADHCTAGALGIQIYPAPLVFGQPFNSESRYGLTENVLEINLSDVIADASGITVTATDSAMTDFTATVVLAPAGDKLVATFSPALPDQKIYTISVAGDAVNDMTFEYVTLIGNTVNVGGMNVVNTTDRTILNTKLGQTADIAGAQFDIFRLATSCGNVDTTDRTILNTKLGNVAN